MRRLYYQSMYEFTNFIMWVVVGNTPEFQRWWKISENYRGKRDAV